MPANGTLRFPAAGSWSSVTTCQQPLSESHQDIRAEKGRQEIPIRDKGIPNTTVLKLSNSPSLQILLSHPHIGFNTSDFFLGAAIPKFISEVIVMLQTMDRQLECGERCLEF